MTLQEIDGLRPGIHLGPYELIAHAGHGGMATVYRARHTGLNRYVALKVLSPDLGRNGANVTRFLREATTAAQLDHPNIVPVYDVGDADGCLYIAMRYVAGGSLAQLIQQRGPLSFPQVLRLLSQVAAALDYAHARGVIHRDVKPGNILLEPGAEGASLADFGIARVVDDATRLTRPASITGTLEYIAPEQIQGYELDFRADLYALGIIAYELLTGRTPFEAASGLAILHKHVYEAPPHPRALRPDLPPAAESAILRMLAKRPAERFPSGELFVAALGRHGAAAVSGANGVGRTIPPTSRPELRRWLPVAAGGVVLVVALSLLTLSSNSAGNLAATNAPADAAAFEALPTATMALLPASTTIALQPTAGAAQVTPAAGGPAPVDAATTRWAMLLGQLDATWGSDWDRTIALLNDFLVQFPGFPPAHDKLYSALVLSAEARLQADQAPEAAVLLERAVELDPARPEAPSALLALTPTPVPTPTTPPVVRATPVPQVRAPAAQPTAVRAVQPTTPPTKPPFVPPALPTKAPFVPPG